MPTPDPGFAHYQQRRAQRIAERQAAYYNASEIELEQWDAPDPRDVEAIDDLNGAIRDAVEAFTSQVWPNLGDDLDAWVDGQRLA